MKIHNIMEEQVEERVNILYDQLNELKPDWYTCDCEQCRLDVISYVLNRIPPKYVASERGITHINAEDKHQLNADIDTIGIEGIKLVNDSKRPYHYKKEVLSEPCEKPFFNFPIFSGVVYDGNTFEPLKKAELVITSDSKQLEMIDSTWSNPFLLTNSTDGNYSFWVKPIETNNIEENKKFNFTVSISSKGYISTSYAFEIYVVSEQCNRNIANSIHTLQIQDIFLFPENTVNSME